MSAWLPPWAVLSRSAVESLGAGVVSGDGRLARGLPGPPSNEGISEVGAADGEADAHDEVSLSFR